MASSLGAEVRDELEFYHPIVLAVGLYALWYVGADPGLFVLWILIAVGYDLGVAATRATGLDRPTLRSVSGLVVFLVGLSLLMTSDTRQWLGVLLTVIGIWVILDGLYERRLSVPDDDAQREPTVGESWQVTTDSRTIFRILATGTDSATRDQLRDETGFDHVRLDRALDRLVESGTVTRQGKKYSIDESNIGASTLIRTMISSTLRRIVRPFLLFVPTVSGS